MPKNFHAHWRDADLSRWRWPNFSPAEIACRGTGRLLIDEEALDRLQALRDALGKPLIVRSASRTRGCSASTTTAARPKSTSRRASRRLRGRRLSGTDFVLRTAREATEGSQCHLLTRPLDGSNLLRAIQMCKLAQSGEKEAIIMAEYKKLISAFLLIVAPAIAFAEVSKDNIEREIEAWLTDWQLIEVIDTQTVGNKITAYARVVWPGASERIATIEIVKMDSGTWYIMNGTVGTGFDVVLLKPILYPVDID